MPEARSREGSTGLIAAIERMSGSLGSAMGQRASRLRAA